MKSKEKAEKLANVKLAVAEKYENLARLAKSQPKKRQFKHRAEKVRRQARQRLPK